MVEHKSFVSIVLGQRKSTTHAHNQLSTKHSLPRKPFCSNLTIFLVFLSWYVAGISFFGYPLGNHNIVSISFPSNKRVSSSFLLRAFLYRVNELDLNREMIEYSRTCFEPLSRCVCSTIRRDKLFHVTLIWYCVTGLKNIDQNNESHMKLA